MKTTELHKTTEILVGYNAWRRDMAGEMPDPKVIGDAIDHAIEVMKAAENLLQQKGRHNTEIAYKALVSAARAA